MPSSPDPSASGEGPRRTSSSFKHVTKNSLVSKSPFKSTTTIQGQQAAGIYNDSGEKVIHEKRASRALGESPEKAAGAAATPKTAIGLGTPSARSRSTSRSRTPSKDSGSTSRIATSLRKVSSERLSFASFGSNKQSTPDAKEAKESKGDSERKEAKDANHGRMMAIETKENDSPIRSGKKTPRQSVGLNSLSKNEYVSKSPFLSTAKRIFSGERRDSPSPSKNSPKAPVEKDDVFSSPSPRVTRKASAELRGASENSARRAGSADSQRVSPSKASPATTRMVSSDSTTSTPSRSASDIVDPVQASPSPARRAPSLSLVTNGITSPLGRTVTDAAGDGSPSSSSPAPIRSAMTPSRRLFGPRDWSGLSQDSPSKNKAVTFSSVAHVREFEPLSNENSLDGSFDSPPAAAVAWMNNESLDGLLSEQNGDDSFGSIGSIGSLSVGSIGSENSIDSLARLRITNPDAPSPEGQGHQRSESTTADFVNTLIEEGLFSPPTGQTPAMADMPTFEMPDEVPPVMSSTPRFSPSSLPEQETNRDQAGIPYGRSHHAERAAAARAAPRPVSHIEQPQIPHQSDEKLLLNGNAAQPSLPYSTPFDSQPIHSHQTGPMPDPFITIQTATKVLSPPHKSREENGIPLGRTSHSERVQAARMLATQSLGLGYPRGNPSPSPIPSVESDTSLPSKDDDGDELFDVSLGDAAPTPSPVPVSTVSQPATATRSVPPAPAPLDLPEHPAEDVDRPADQEVLAKPVERDEDEDHKVSTCLHYIPYCTDCRSILSSPSFSLCL